ncbi:rhodanese-like domain-containing protein [Robertkochia aurantiaca]|uniref:rhodanese-like domain-containing protein n=1 Tax=Robertkochia aurantiaca TaxID=2873700 RepID=UPI001CCA106C|nr:rhodanese-like domain-containing protein [Robertkochia sp. 3YJGBD-33]
MKTIYLIVMLIFTGLVSLTAQVNTLDINKVPDDLKEKGVLIDVRTPEEYQEGHLPEAINIDWYSDAFLKEVMEVIRDNAGDPVLLYCRSGNRSAQASAKLDSLGFRKIYNLDGGYAAWSEKNKKQ